MRKRAEEQVILMEGSERVEEERGVTVRVLKVHSEDNVVTPVLTRSCQNNIYYSYRWRLLPSKHSSFDLLWHGGSQSEAPDAGGTQVLVDLYAALPSASTGRYWIMNMLPTSNF